jgi:hypothetical protein
MRRRSRAGGEPAKAQRRKTAAHKSRVASKAARPLSSSAAREETKVARLTRERDEAFEQQAATADVLKVISRATLGSVADLEAEVEAYRDRAERVYPATLPAYDCLGGSCRRLVGWKNRTRCRSATV